ncbi:UDP-glycosyltransferase 84B2-like [Macadamia integrifolia]|uniref:UDP-glycosyltransferase 84B2-like n=1 Tax=Macadamia integrifolia TaxID=60698 RepID=UPI001C50237B|nr:UDP-glycosyltransferase 84B2-like [Macadamia integrifolia]XP_042504144.1 UDP-glycosyltransferase 84B2-like [Macadamia integrifolia]
MLCCPEPTMVASKESREGEVHVLMVAFSAQGHMNPMLRFGSRLVAKGLHVTLATTDCARDRILKSLSSTTIVDDKKIRLEFFSDGLSVDFDRLSHMDHFMDSIGKFGPINLSKLINDLSGDAHRPKFSCIIGNPFVPWVADVAAQHNIPCALLWIQPCALFAIYYRFYNQLNSFPTQPNSDSVVHLPGLPPLQTTDLPSFVLPSNTFGSFPKLLSNLFQSYMNKFKWVFGNSFYELEKDVVESMAELCPIRPVGPLVPSTLVGLVEGGDIEVDMWKPEERCIEWLDRKPVSSVIYVSFGSILVLSEKQMGNIAMGLKNSDRPFLWVVKPQDNTKPVGLPAGFLEETEDRGLVVPWCPQTKVLDHPAVACFMSHCGWNSTLETVAAGVPMIAFPQWTDQPTNAKLIVDVFKMGVRVEPDPDGTVSKEEVERCIDEITKGPKSEELKRKAVHWKEASKMAVAEHGSSDRNIQIFVDEIVGKHSSSPSMSLHSIDDD